MLYAYCLSDEAAGWRAGCAGVGGAEVRVVLCGDLGVLASEFAGARVELTRENLLAHNAVVGDVLARVTPLPFRFGTLAGEERLRGYVETNREALFSALARVRGCVEMSVKILWDAGGAGAAAEDERRAAEGREGETAAPTVSPAREGGGAAYLRAKRRELAEQEEAQARAEELAAWLGRELGGCVRESRVRVRAEGRVAVRAAHLVERARLSEYRARVRALAESRRGAGLRFLTSGAWPPYSFSQLDTEVSAA